MPELFPTATPLPTAHDFPPGGPLQTPGAGSEVDPDEPEQGNGDPDGPGKAPGDGTSQPPASDGADPDGNLDTLGAGEGLVDTNLTQTPPGASGNDGEDEASDVPWLTVLMAVVGVALLLVIVAVSLIRRHNRGAKVSHPRPTAKAKSVRAAEGFDSASTGGAGHPSPSHWKAQLQLNALFLQCDTMLQKDGSRAIAAIGASPPHSPVQPVSVITHCTPTQDVICEADFHPPQPAERLAPHAAAHVGDSAAATERTVPPVPLSALARAQLQLNALFQLADHLILRKEGSSRAAGAAMAIPPPDHSPQPSISEVAICVPAGTVISGEDFKLPQPIC